jgi:hypothetical protein
MTEPVAVRRAVHVAVWRAVDNAVRDDVCAAVKRSLKDPVSIASFDPLYDALYWTVRGEMLL